MPISSLARLHDLAKYSGCGRRARPDPAAPLSRGTEGLQTLRWRERIRTFGPPRTGADFYSDVCSESCRRKWDQRFESALLQRRVREPSVPAWLSSIVPPAAIV